MLGQRAVRESNVSMLSLMEKAMLFLLLGHTTWVVWKKTKNLKILNSKKTFSEHLMDLQWLVKIKCLWANGFLLTIFQELMTLLKTK